MRQTIVSCDHCAAVIPNVSRTIRLPTGTKIWMGHPTGTIALDGEDFCTLEHFYEWLKSKVKGES